MKFCFKCGQQLKGNEKFCPKCGQKLNLPQQTVLEEHREPKRVCSRHGIIFTDLNALSSFMRCNHDDLRNLFEKYAEFMALSDIDYTLVDVSDYKFRSKGAGRRGEKPSFNENSPWWDYQHVLYDVMCYEKENKLPESNYLFIIGGHEIIPVPVINH